MEDQKDIHSKEQQQSESTTAPEKQQEEPATAGGQARVPRDRNVTPQVSKVYSSPWLSRSREEMEAELHERQQHHQQQKTPAPDENKAQQAKEGPMSWVAQRVLSTGWLSASRNRPPRDEEDDYPRDVGADQQAAGGAQAQAQPEAPERTQEPPQPRRILSTGWLSLGRKDINTAPVQDQDASQQPLQSPVRNWLSSGWFNLGGGRERNQADNSDTSQ